MRFSMSLLYSGVRISFTSVQHGPKSVIAPLPYLYCATEVAMRQLSVFATPRRQRSPVRYIPCLEAPKHAKSGASMRPSGKPSRSLGQLRKKTPPLFAKGIVSTPP